jgi:hypothetical protein
MALAVAFPDATIHNRFASIVSIINKGYVQENTPIVTQDRGCLQPANLRQTLCQSANLAHGSMTAIVGCIKARMGFATNMIPEVSGFTSR